MGFAGGGVNPVEKALKAPGEKEYRPDFSTRPSRNTVANRDATTSD